MSVLSAIRLGIFKWSTVALADGECACPLRKLLLGSERRYAPIGFWKGYLQRAPPASDYPVAISLGGWERYQRAD
jgi:hypothetical protein